MKKKISNKRRMVLLVILAVLLGTWRFIFNMMKVLGKIPEGERLRKVQQSPNYRDGSFQNLEPTDVTAKNASYVRMLKEYSSAPKTVRPSRTVPSIKADLKNLDSDKPTVIWFGHSSYLINAKGYTILVDPVLSGYASPVSFLGKSFPGTDIYDVNDLPAIDLLVLTHDHYDHLDYQTLIRLKDKAKKIVAPLGVGTHLEYWGIAPDKITELDWKQSILIEKDIRLTATPARHFSGRSLQRGKSLWTAYVLHLQGHTLYLGGDSGYSNHFKSIGEEFGPFDLAILENGQYGKDWPSIHTFPEETLQAAIDLRAEVLLPVHWGKFVLANHAWNEPIKRLHNAAKDTSMKITTPQIGEMYVLGDPLKQSAWWDFD